MPTLRRAAGLTALLLLACATAGAAAPAAAAHERACAAAFGVLQRCVAAGGSRTTVRERCCSLLESYETHGCLCPGCPLDASEGATSVRGQALAAQLEPLQALCLSPDAYAASADAQPALDEDDAMADAAGAAAEAQGPQAVAQALGQAAAHQGYDDALGDADAAFLLVDPAAAAAFARRAVGAAAAAASESEAQVEARLLALLEGLGAGASTAAADEEDAASAGAVGDAGDGEEHSGAAPVLLAAPGAVPDTPEQRRASALAAAVEAGQEVAHRLSGLASPSSKLSFDVEVDAGNPEASRRVAGSLAAVLSSWQAAAGSATSQAELAAALEDTARRVAAVAASGALGRAGLQPKQLLLEGYVEERRGGGASATEPALCACMDPRLIAPPAPAGDWAAAAYTRYVAARLALCRFSCTHQKALSVLLAVELALCAVWLALWALRGSTEPQPSAASGSGRQQRGEQFVIASAADPEWQVELKQPLLGSSRD